MNKCKDFDHFNSPYSTLSSPIVSKPLTVLTIETGILLKVRVNALKVYTYSYKFLQNQKEVTKTMAEETTETEETSEEAEEETEEATEVETPAE